jgi:hypothetical protein
MGKPVPIRWTGAPSNCKGNFVKALISWMNSELSKECLHVRLRACCLKGDPESAAAWLDDSQSLPPGSPLPARTDAADVSRLMSLPAWEDGDIGRSDHPSASWRLHTVLQGKLVLVKLCQPENT